MSTSAQTHRFQAEAKEVLDLMIHSLYKHKEIFLRELISNASDAISKRRVEGLCSPELALPEDGGRIRIEAIARSRTLCVHDDGIGMSREELIEHLGTIARSGTRAFAEARRSQGVGEAQAAELIGQFGVGFYSSLLVAAEVEVITRRAGSQEAWRFHSRGDGAYTIEPAERAEAGTSVCLRVREPREESESGEAEPDWLDEELLRGIVKRWSDFVARPALLAAAKAQPELASLCVSGIRKLPRAAAPQLGMWLAGELPKARPEYARNLCATIAWVDDGDSMAALVEALGHAESAVRDAAQLALREISGLSLPAEPQAWAPWFDEQRHWKETRLPLLAAAIGLGNTREALAALKECAGRRTWKREQAGVLMLGLKRPESGLNSLAVELLTALGAAAVCDQLNPLDSAHQTLRASLCGAAGSAPLRKP